MSGGLLSYLRKRLSEGERVLVGLLAGGLVFLVQPMGNIIT